MPPTARPPSIGERSSGYRRVREQAPLPSTRDQVLSEVSRILGLGLVQKLIIEVGAPIVFERLLKDDAELSPELEVVEAQDLYAAARNAEMLDFKATVTNPFEIIFLAFRAIEAKKLRPKAFLGSNWITVRKWFRLGDYDDVSSIYGVPAHNYEEIPDDVLLLLAGDGVEADEVQLSLRISMDLPGERRKK